MKKIFLTVLLSTSYLPAVYRMGDVVENFTAPICVNGEGTVDLYDYNGATNGGDYHVIWLILFTSW